MERALYDFAEAALGRNSGMRWCLSEPILRRQILPIFDRCANGDLSAEQALDIAVDFAATRTTKTVDTLAQLFHDLEAAIERDMSEGYTLTALSPLQELFLGLDADIEWVTDENITRQELYPIFVRVAVGKFTATEGVLTFCDQMSARRDFYLDQVQGLTKVLSTEIVEVLAVQGGDT